MHKIRVVKIQASSPNTIIEAPYWPNTHDPGNQQQRRQDFKKTGRRPALEALEFDTPALYLCTNILVFFSEVFERIFIYRKKNMVKMSV